MKKIFYKLPYFLKFFLVNISGWFLVRKRFTRGFFKALNYYKEVDYNEKFVFNDILFSQQFENKNIKDNISLYPIIDKQFVKEQYSNIINEDHIKDFLYTSGTTGSGLKFPVSQDFIDNQWAVFWKFRNIHGISLQTWCAYIIGQTLFDINSMKKPLWIKSYFTKQLLFSQYHLNEENVEVYLTEILNNNIKWLHAYPSVLNNFANLIIKLNLQELAYQLRLDVITVSSEKLFDFQRKNIEQIFNCKVRELYGLTEGTVNIFECEFGTLHVDESYSYVEFIQKGNSDEYEIIGTSYHNKAFPLIRYKTGDTCLLYDDTFTCECGRKSRMVKEILGRDEDYLILNDGRKIGRLDHIFKDMMEIDEAQIFQKEKGKAIFKIVKGLTYEDKTEIKLINEIKQKLGKDFHFNIEYLSSIAKTNRGKLKFVVSEVNE